MYNEDIISAVPGFRGVSLEEARKIIKTGEVTPTLPQNQMPLDWEIVEYTIGDNASSMSEEEVNNYIKALVPWYDGTIKSIRGGLNLTTDFENVKGYAGEEGVVLGINFDYREENAAFSDSYLYLKEASKAKIVFYFYKDIFYSPEEFREIIK